MNTQKIILLSKKNIFSAPSFFMSNKLIKTFILLTFLSVSFLQTQANAATLSPIEILQKVDEHRGIQNKSFAMEIEVQSTISGSPRGEVKLMSYVDNQSNPDNWNTLIRITYPSQRKGQLILLEENRMWFYKHGTRRAIRISPAQRLIGEASNGDIASANFREYYNIVSLSNKTLGKTKAYVFQLKRKKTSAPYDHIIVWVQKKTYFPIKAEFYSKSGKKIKSCYYRKYKKILGVKRATELVMVDELRPNRITKINIIKMKVQSLPKNYYKANQLPNIGF